MDEESQIAGRVNLPGRAQALVPVVHLDGQDDQHAVGRVTFGGLHLGRNGAVHGGAIPLVFDEVMGGLSNTGGRVPGRTAYQHLRYPQYHAHRAGASGDRAGQTARKAANGSCPGNCATATRCAPTWKAC